MTAFKLTEQAYALTLRLQALALQHPGDFRRLRIWSKANDRYERRRTAHKHNWQPLPQLPHELHSYLRCSSCGTTRLQYDE